MIRSRAAAVGAATTTTTAATPGGNHSHQRNSFRKPHPNNKTAMASSVPFVVIATFMVMAIMGMGYTSIRSMIYITQGIDKGPPNRHLHVVQSSSGTGTTRASPQQAREHLQIIRQRYQQRYDGPPTDIKTDKNYDNVAETLLQTGLHVFGDVDHTARRILEASWERRPFVMAFTGYSVTVGRGNFLNQSFPFVVQDILRDTMEKLFDIPLIVKNAAIGGIPSFPYGFCLEHFVGLDPDVISWDYSMNENGKDASVLEAWIRQATQQLPRRPMVLMIDTNANRMNVLEQYTARGWLHDALAVSKKEIVATSMLNVDPLPAGFQDWEEFGSPPNCPGRGSWHPKKQEHALIGWLIAMHFVEAMERAITIQETPNLLANVLEVRQPRQLEQTESPPMFAQPLSAKLPNNDPEVNELLFGHLQKQTDQTDAFLMKDLSCRTSFLPATDHSKTLPSVVISGLAEGDLDIMVDRTDEHYKEGWVLDVSKVERDTKRKVERCGGLGYVDMKIALYGIPESGQLRLWLPFEGPSHDDHDHYDGKDMQAKHWFDDLIICEANEKRDDGACKLDRDLDIVVGGVPVQSIRPIKGAGEYLKRTTCVNLGVPVDATMTTLGNVRSTDGRPLSKEDKTKFGNNGEDNAVGLVVDITAKSSVTRSKGACCLSHIVWEQH